MSSNYCIAQPTLPDIKGIYKKGVVTLTWNCQYDRPRSIEVRRSSDSVADYEVIGEVKQLKKGVQFFIDNQPEEGKNYYKLLITFNSGLKWSSNHVGVIAGEKKSKRSESKASKKAKDEENEEEKDNVKEEMKDDENEGENDEIKIEKNIVNKIPAITTKKDSLKFSYTQPARKLVMIKDTPEIKKSTEYADTGNKQTATIKPAAKKLKFTLQDDKTLNPELFIQSKYVNTDSITGHVLINLPEDIPVHHYSMKIFDKNNHLIWQVPYFNESKIVMDKRNFQQKGIYKFVLRKDNLELDQGNFIIN